MQNLLVESNLVVAIHVTIASVVGRETIVSWNAPIGQYDENENVVVVVVVVAVVARLSFVRVVDRVSKTVPVTKHRHSVVPLGQIVP